MGSKAKHDPASTLEESQADAQEHRDRIMVISKHLRSTLPFCEGEIHRKWRNKRPDQKKAFLKRCWPAIPDTHRQDYDILRKLQINANQYHPEDVLYAMAFPHLNVEDLCSGDNILLLLKSRGRNHPEIFAHADVELIKSLIHGSGFGESQPELQGAAAVFTEGNDTYGQLFNIADRRDARQLLDRGVALPARVAALVLEFQHATYFLLGNFFQHIMEPATTPEITKTGIKPEPSLDQSSHELWTTVAAIRLESVYRAPGNIQVDKLRQLTTGKLFAARDHIHLLREDPSYFHTTLRQWGDNRAGMPLDSSHVEHVSQRSAQRRSQYWTDTLCGLVIQSYHMLGVWTALDAELEALGLALNEWNRQPRGRTKLNQPAPLSISLPYKRVRFVVEETRLQLGSLIRGESSGLPPLRDDFFRSKRPNPLDPNFSMKYMDPKHKPDELLYLVAALADKSTSAYIQSSDVLDRIEQIISLDPKEKARISPWLLFIFSELAVIVEVQRQLDLFQPWLSMMKKEPVLEYTDDEMPLGPLLNFNKICLPDPGAMFDPSPLVEAVTLDYPAERKRSSVTVEKMRHAEALLDETWAKFEALMRDRLLLDSKFAGLTETLRSRPIERTLPWVKPEPKQRATKSKKSVPEIDVKLQLLELEQRTEQTVSTEVAINKKEKEKTRGAAVDSEVPTAIPAVDRVPLLQPVQFSIKKRFMKVFRTLFFDPESGGSPGEIPWTDFLAAMGALGFNIEKLDGSAWSFSHPSFGSIQFHEPHPSPKLSYHGARCIGYRLTRNYGWTNASFSQE